MIKFNVLVIGFFLLGVHGFCIQEALQGDILSVQDQDPPVTIVSDDVQKITNLRMGRDGSYFYVKVRSDETPKVYYRESHDAGEQLLYDLPAYKNEKGEMLRVLNLIPDHKAQRLVIALAPGESDMADLLIIDLKGNILDDRLKGVSGKVSWHPDRSYILYHRWSSTDLKDNRYRRNSKTLLHKIGRPQAEDVDIFSAELHPELNIGDLEMPFAYFDRELKAIIGVVTMTDGRLKIYIKRGNLLQPTRWEFMAKPTDYVTAFFVSKDRVYYKTFQDVPNYMIVASLFRWPDVCNGDMAVPEFDNAKIDTFVANNDGLYFTTIDDSGRVELWFKPRREDLYQPVELPGEARQLKLFTNNPLSSDLWILLQGRGGEDIRYKYLRKSRKFVHDPVIAEPETAEIRD